MTLAFLGLAALCIIKDYTGSLPWLTAMISLPWTAYGVSQCFYYNKAKNENMSGGIKYDTVMAELNKDVELEDRFQEQFESLLEDSTTTDINLDYGV